MGAKMSTWDLCGSPARDRFRLLHKQKLGKGYHGSDGDLFLIEFDRRTPVALLDFKSNDADTISDTEKALYLWAEESGCPVYLVWAMDLEAGKFQVDRWSVTGKYEHVKTTYTWDEFGKWELELRQKANILL